MLLYLVKHSRPDLSNGTRELSKVMDKAMEGHMQEFVQSDKVCTGYTNHRVEVEASRQ